MRTEDYALERVLADLEDAAQSLIPALKKRRIYDSYVVLAYLLPRDDLFVLLLAPHGEVLACAPYTDAALTLLRSEITPERLNVPGETSKWANEQRWEFCVVKRIYAVRGGRHGV